VGVGLEPACVKTCPTGAISFGTKDDMVSYGKKRAGELKDRGFQNAGALQPAGRGRHARDVRAQARRQAAVSRTSPPIPSVSPMVSLWKGLAKPLAVAGMLGAVVAGFFHYMKVGPIEEKAEKEEA
jgi:formate dehydrogenase iron-sulfur subunit